MADANLGMGWTGGNPFLGTSNPYLQQNIDSTMGDMAKGYNMTTKPNTESAMVGSGSFGNSGLQQQQNYQQSQLNDSMGKTAAGMRLNDYNQQQNMYQWDQGYNRNLFNDANQQNHQNLVDTMGLLGQANQFNQQDIANTTNVQNTPMNYAQQFSNMANSVANGFSGTSQTTNMPGSPLTGALGGWQLGSAYGKTA